MLFFLVSCFSFILLYKFSFFQPTPSWKLEMRFWSFQSFLRHLLTTHRFVLSSHPLDSKQMGTISPKAGNKMNRDEVCLLDLPDLPLECILQKLSPAGLTSLSGACRSLRALCTQDHLWEKHLSQKWGNLLMGGAAHREWQSYIATQKRQTPLGGSRGQGYFGVFTSGPTWWPLPWRKDLKLTTSSVCLPVDSLMAWYLSLETGKFSFPAQVYNRENGSVGFLLSCYDAQVSYDSKTNSFTARYTAHGRPTTEENIERKRLRAPVVDTPPFDLHVSDCLNELQPGDHIEIQWRKSKEFPYGWWYGVVGHSGSCDGNVLYCQCRHCDVVHLEFKQYGQGSRWREVAIDRKEHREVGNETDGFYAGIRKLCCHDEISSWERLWPNRPLE